MTTPTTNPFALNTPYTRAEIEALAKRTARISNFGNGPMLTVQVCGFHFDFLSYPFGGDDCQWVLVAVDGNAPEPPKASGGLKVIAAFAGGYAKIDIGAYDALICELSKLKEENKALRKKGESMTQPIPHSPNPLDGGDYTYQANARPTTLAGGLTVVLPAAEYEALTAALRLTKTEVDRLAAQLDAIKSGQCSLCKQVDAMLGEKPAEEEKITDDARVFGKGQWVYCNQHLAAHETGWCTIGVQDKIALGVDSHNKAVDKCRAWGLKLYSDMKLKDSP